MDNKKDWPSKVIEFVNSEKGKRALEKADKNTKNAIKRLRENLKIDWRELFRDYYK